MRPPSSASTTPRAKLLPWLRGQPATGTDPDLARGTLRFSLGHTSTEADVEALAKAIGPAVERARAAGFGFRQTGPGTMPLFLFDDDPDMRKGFRFASEMLARGVYTHPWHNMFLCAAMTEADIDGALDAAEGAFGVLKQQVRELAPVEKMAFLSAGAR